MLSMNFVRFTKQHAFYAIMLGQLVSTVGSSMTRFGLGIWVLQQTGNTTAYTFLLFFAVLPLGLGSLLAGPLVDRWDRRNVMIASNAVASASTLVIALLYFADALASWHLYMALTINGVANAFVLPSIDAIVPLLVEKDQLGRAAGLTQLVQGMEIVAGPALAGVLLNSFDLGAIFVVDFVTFGAVVLALLLVVVPGVRDSAENTTSFWQSFTFGINYIRERPAFVYLMGFVTLTVFLGSGIGYALLTPIVLSFADEQAAGFTISAFGVGAMVAGILLAVWGGPPRRMDGMLVATALGGVACIAVGLFEAVWWVALSVFCIGACFIFMVGLNRVIWQVKASPDVLGRIFALRVFAALSAQSLGILIAGPLAERVFEPLMQPDGLLATSVGLLLGTGAGRGMAVMYLIVGLLLITTAGVSALLPKVRLMEDRVPDYAHAFSGAD